MLSKVLPDKSVTGSQFYFVDSCARLKMGRVSYFIEAWKEKYPFIKAGTSKSVAHCGKCNCEISVSNGGVTAIDRHVETDKHKRNSIASVLSTKLTAHFRNKTLGKAEKELAAAEGLFAYHTIKHNQSFK